MANRVMESAAPNGQLRPAPNCSAIRLPSIIFLPPPSTLGVTKAPSYGMNTRMDPAIIPGFTSGMTTRRNTLAREA
jgi:hypothetical protein